MVSQMEYRIIKMGSNMGHPHLELEINGEYACILAEQKPTLFFEGYIFIEPQKKWRKLLPVIDHVSTDGVPMRLEGFIRSFILRSVIIEVYETSPPSTFNKKWAGKVLYEDEDHVIKEQEKWEGIKKYNRGKDITYS